jgi:hypothetical protein
VGSGKDMTTPPTALERALVADLRSLGDRLADEKFCHELYRTLTDTAWRREGDDGHVALSWKRVEEIVNELRGERGRPPLALAQTGGEGTLADTVVAELGRLGWRGAPADTSEHDPAHVWSGHDEPRTPPSDRFAEAHEAAEAERRRKIRG